MDIGDIRFSNNDVNSEYFIKGALGVGAIAAAGDKFLFGEPDLVKSLMFGGAVALGTYAGPVIGQKLQILLVPKPTKPTCFIRSKTFHRCPFLREAPKPQKSQYEDDNSLFDDKGTELLGRDKRMLLSKIQQYKSLFPDELGKFKTKKNCSAEDLKLYLTEMESIVDTSSVEQF